jgi:hypothetical protein
MRSAGKTILTSLLLVASLLAGLAQSYGRVVCIERDGRVNVEDPAAAAACRERNSKGNDHGVPTGQHITARAGCVDLPVADDSKMSVRKSVQPDLNPKILPSPMELPSISTVVATVPQWIHASNPAPIATTEAHARLSTVILLI